MNPAQAKKAPDLILKSTPKRKKTKAPLSVTGSTTGNNTLISTGNTTYNVPLTGNFPLISKSNTSTTSNVPLTGGTTTATVTNLPPGIYGSTTATVTNLPPGIYGSTTTWATYQSPESKVAVLGGEFDLYSRVDPALVVSLVGFLGIGYYVHLKDCGFDLSGLPKEIRVHLDALATQHLRVERIKKALDTDAGA